VQQSLLSFLTSDFLNYPVKNPGEGMNIFAELGFATPLGQWVFGAAGAVMIPGEYNPYDAELTYQPGTRLIGTMGIERAWGSKNFISADMVIVSSAEDKADGETIFRDGSQFDLRLSGRVGGGRVSIAGGVRYIMRGKDQRPNDADAKLVAEARNHNGNDLRIQLAPRITLSPKVGLWASVETKILAANDYETTHALFEDAARIQGAGGGVELRLNPRSVVRLGARVWSGSSDGAFGIGPFDLTGYEIIQHLTVTL
jgi:hypothetical protein